MFFFFFLFPGSPTSFFLEWRKQGLVGRGSQCDYICTDSSSHLARKWLVPFVSGGRGNQCDYICTDSSRHLASKFFRLCTGWKILLAGLLENQLCIWACLTYSYRATFSPATAIQTVDCVYELVLRVHIGLHSALPLSYKQ